MHRLNIARTLTASATVLVSLYLFSTVGVAQKGQPPSTEGAIVKSKDNITNNRMSAGTITGELRLGEEGVANASPRTIQIVDGRAALGNLNGSYWIEARVRVSSSSGINATVTTKSASSAPDSYIVTIEGLAGGPTHWKATTSDNSNGNAAGKLSFTDTGVTGMLESRDRTMAGKGEDRITFKADGTHPVTISFRIPIFGPVK